jgi:DNA-damage-inducible protein J
MPTIQIRTDDQTKTASAALFERLGITMSDAINMFLRQSVMRGGIPFPVTVTGRQETAAELIENEALVDALKRYRSISGKNDFDITMTEPFFRAVETLGSDKNMKITLQENAVKVRLNFKGTDYVLDYNFDEPDNVFILSRKNGKLFVKDCRLSKIAETLEWF